MATLFKGLSVTILLIALIVTSFHGAQGEDQQLESQCRPYVEKALKEQLQDAGDVPIGSAGDDSSGEDDNESGDNIILNSLEDSDQKNDDGSNETVEKDESGEKENESLDVEDSKGASAEETVSAEDEPGSVESVEKENEEDTENKSAEEESKSSEETTQEETDADAEETEAITATENDSTETAEVTDDDTQEEENSKEDATPLGREEDDSKSDETKEEDVAASDSVEDTDSVEGDDSSDTADASVEDKKESDDDQQENETVEVSESNSEESQENKEDLAESDDKNTSQEDAEPSEKSGEGNDGSSEEETATSIEEGGENETKEESSSEKSADDQVNDDSESSDSKETEETVESKASEESNETVEATETDGTDSEKDSKEDATEEKPTEDDSTESGESDESHPEEDLLLEIDIPDNLRSRDHVTQILRFDDEFAEKDLLLEKSADIILRELKRIYDNSIKPLEILYRYRDLSNRHFGDPEIFSKPLVLFMGPWSGGKSSIINYLTDNEYTSHTLRTGAEPSPAYFNILMHGEVPEVLDGTQLAADWTFSGLQKFGQGLEDRLRGLKLPNKLLEKINIVEIPGILEVRKQVSRLFPFNDACQWFIDRADIIFLVYDPSKLDVGPETEAILDQLKGREYQTRIILNKADQVKPEELMRVQGALIWNISPLMSSAQPPIMYTTSLWSSPYEVGAPARLLRAQEIGFLKDLRSAIDKRIENKIASARRFAVRVRNHAKMVDCYLTTYYNHKSLFGNKKIIANTIIEHPQDYHIYEGLSTLTNISRYDLPDPDVYKDFFKLNPLYDFQQLAATCTYFRGCPINKLDVAIAYDLPELVGKYKKMVESASGSDDSKTNSNS